MKFVKMHGAGNDYVIVNCFEERIDDPPAMSRVISDRHKGIGADGLIMICPAESAAVRMEMYNADGSRGQMCGNGIRCVAKFAYDRGLTRDPSIPIETDDGLKTAECTVENGKVTRVQIDMGPPRFAPALLPVLIDGEEVVNSPIDINGRTLHMTCVSMGNPHAVIFVDDFNSIDLAADGRAVERHALFPERTNTHFVRVESHDRVTVLTWERGSGRTLACGTGVSAVCVAGAKTDRTVRRITARAEGGELDLEWADNDHVYKIGPAVEVFSGDWLL